MSSDESDDLPTPIDYWIKMDQVLGLKIAAEQVQAKGSEDESIQPDVKNISNVKKRLRVPSSGKLYKSVKIPHKGAIVYEDSDDDESLLPAGRNLVTDEDSSTTDASDRRKVRRKVFAHQRSSQREVASSKNPFISPSSEESKLEEHGKEASSIPRNRVKLSRSKRRQNYKYASIIFPDGRGSDLWRSSATKNDDDNKARNVRSNASNVAGTELKSHTSNHKSRLRCASAQNQPARNAESIILSSSCLPDLNIIPKPYENCQTLAGDARLKDLTAFDKADKLEACQDFCGSSAQNQTAVDAGFTRHLSPSSQEGDIVRNFSDRCQSVLVNSSVFTDLLFSNNRVKPPPSRRLSSGFVGKVKASVNDTTLLDDSSLWKERERYGD